VRVETPSELELAILEQLATYRFLTIKQLLTLGVTKNERHLQAMLSSMAGEHRKPKPASKGPSSSSPSQITRYRPYRSPAVKRLKFGVMAGGIGRLPYVHTLTRHGAELLADIRGHETVVSVPSVIRFPRDEYFHRLGCIDCHMAVRTWTERNRAAIDFYHVDFSFSRKVRGRPIADTRVELKGGRIIKPDAIFQITACDRKARLYPLEFSAGPETARIESQLDAYRYALHEEAIEKAYRYEHGVRVLAVFKHESTLTHVFDRLAERSDFQPFRTFLLFKTLDELRMDLVYGWRQLGANNRVPLFMV
jgi:hypothetical protein